jgi:hypothetical protein
MGFFCGQLSAVEGVLHGKPLFLTFDQEMK